MTLMYVLLLFHAVGVCLPVCIFRGHIDVDFTGTVSDVWHFTMGTDVRLPGRWLLCVHKCARMEPTAPWRRQATSSAGARMDSPVCQL